MARKQLGSSPSNSTDAVTKAYVDSGIATVANKTISGANNTVTGVSGMLVACQVSTQGSETYTISSGTVTQIAGTTINGYSPQVGDRVLVITAPATSGTGTGYTNTVQPTNGIYRVTSNTTNISLTRAYDMSGSENPAGKLVWVQSGSWSAQTLWWVDTPVNSNTAFTWGTTSLSFTPAFGGNGNISIYALHSEIFKIDGVAHWAQLVQNSSATADQTLTLPAPTTDTIVSRTSTDTLTNKTISGSSNTVTNLGSSVSSTGTYASLPAAGNTGRVYICTDVGLVLRDNGTTWDIVWAGDASTGAIAPPSSGWSTTTLGTATFAADRGGRLLTCPTSSQTASATARLEYRSLSPTSNYTATWYFDLPILPHRITRYGAVLRESSSGKFIVWGNMNYYDGSSYAWNNSVLIKYTNTTTISSESVLGYPPLDGGGMPQWFRIRDDNTNRYYETSLNGLDWATLSSEARTTFLTADQIGWGMDFAVSSPTRTTTLRLRSFSVV